jgi:ankyrin repeat protein
MRWIGVVLLPVIIVTACGPKQKVESMTSLEAAIVVDLSPAKVKALLEKGADPNQRSSNGYTALIHASDALRLPGERDHLSSEEVGKADQIVALLLTHGADPNLQPQNGSSALAAAIAANRPVAARSLLNAQADPNGRESGGVTPLMLSAHHCRPEIARNLLEHGADPSRRDESGAAAVDWAKRSGCRSVEDLVAAAATVQQ